MDFYSAATGKLNTHDHHYLSSYIVHENKLQKTHPQNKTKQKCKESPMEKLLTLKANNGLG